MSCCISSTKISDQTCLQKLSCNSSWVCLQRSSLVHGEWACSETLDAHYQLQNAKNPQALLSEGVLDVWSEDVVTVFEGHKVLWRPVFREQGKDRIRVTFRPQSVPQMLLGVMCPAPHHWTSLGTVLLDPPPHFVPWKIYSQPDYFLLTTVFRY